jgi:hypothetical protein
VENTPSSSPATAHPAEEYESLRDEMLRADDQAIQLAGFSLVAASFLAAAVIEASSPATKSLLLIGFNIIIFTLVLKVREKRGQQGRIAAYVRIFHEEPTGWETRVQRMRDHDKATSTSPWGSADPRGWHGSAIERFTRRASVGESLVFSVLSTFALLALPLSLWAEGGGSVNRSTTPVGWFALAVAVQAVVTGLVLWASRTFSQLESNSVAWQAIWANARAVEELARKVAASGDVILINGGPASGKTSLARALESLLGVVRLSKDEVKEGTYDAWRAAGLIDERGPGDWTLRLPGRLPRRSTDVGVLDELDDEVTAALIQACEEHRPCVIDTNVAERQFGAMSALAPRLVEIHLSAGPDELTRRYNARRGRHAVHVSRSDGASHDWGGMRPMAHPGTAVFSLDTGSGAGNAELVMVLAMLASHYGVRFVTAAGTTTSGLEDARQRLLAGLEIPAPPL